MEVDPNEVNTVLLREALNFVARMDGEFSDEEIEEAVAAALDVEEREVTAAKVTERVNKELDPRFPDGAGRLS